MDEWRAILLAEEESEASHEVHPRTVPTSILQRLILEPLECTFHAAFPS